MEGTRIMSLLIFMLILMLNIFSVPVMAPEGELEIVVDGTSKEVSPGEDAVFYWTVYNNDTFTSYDLSVTSEEPTKFSETSFTLDPGESRTITQTIETSSDDSNNTHYTRLVRWEGVWYQGLMSGSIIPMDTHITVTVITDEEDELNGDWDGSDGNGGDGGSNGEDDDKGDDSTPGFESIFLIAAIFIAIIIMRKKRSKFYP